MKKKRKTDYPFRADRLEYLCNQTGAILKQTADASGISYAAFLNYMKGRSIPRIEKLIELADYFGVSMDYFVGDRVKDAGEEESAYRAHFAKMYRDSYETMIRASRSKLLVYGNGEAPWPYNLVDQILQESTDFVLEQEQLDGLNEAISMLTEKQRTVTLEYFRDGKTFQEIGDEFGLTHERIRQIVMKSVRILRHPSRVNLILYGDGATNPLNQRRKELQEMKATLAAIETEIEDRSKALHLIQDQLSQYQQDPVTMKLEDMDLDVRSYGALGRAGCRTALDVLTRARSGKLHCVRHMGGLSVQRTIQRLRALGYDEQFPEEEPA